MLKDEEEGRDVIVHTYWETQTGKLCYSEKLRGLTEKGKPNDARQDYFDHLWYSGSQGSNRQELIGNFVCKIICTSTVDYFGHSYLQPKEIRHMRVLDDTVVASFFERGRPWYNCSEKGSWTAIVIQKALSWPDKSKLGCVSAEEKEPG